jgi:DNA-binding MarR family transcriptional regulator
MPIERTDNSHEWPLSGLLDSIEPASRLDAMSTSNGSLSAAENVVVNGVAEYYWQNDGMPHDRGRVIGWLIISDPPRQSTKELQDRLGVDREAIDRVADQLVPANVILREEGADGEYYLSMTDDSWPNAVRHVFANFPEFHDILRYGLEVLSDAPGERRERTIRLERLFGFLAAEIPALLDRYERQTAATAS